MGTLISIVLGYLIGSVSFAIVLSKILKQPDPRTSGSGNAGATNILRTVGKNQAIAVLVGDALKGIIAVLIGRMLGAHEFGLGLVAFAAVVGHIFPLYFKFKGGKGVATALGSILFLSLSIGVISIIVWLVLAYVTRFASLASIVTLIVAIVLSLLFGLTYYTIPLLLIAAIVIWAHRENITRLKTKTESKISF